MNAIGRDEGFGVATVAAGKVEVPPPGLHRGSDGTTPQSGSLATTVGGGDTVVVGQSGFDGSTPQSGSTATKVVGGVDDVVDVWELAGPWKVTLAIADTAITLSTRRTVHLRFLSCHSTRRVRRPNSIVRYYTTNGTPNAGRQPPRMDRPSTNDLDTPCEAGHRCSELRLFETLELCRQRPCLI